LNIDNLHYDIFCGIDVGKKSHYMVALSKSGEKRILSKEIPQTESGIRQALFELSELGKVLVTVDQVGNIGRLVVALARDMNIDVAHLSPRSFKQVSTLYGEDKSDAKDAYIISDVSRSMPRVIELVKPSSEALAELKFLLAYRSDITKECTSLYNRAHDLLLQISPPLETLFSKRELHNDLQLRLIKHYGGPNGFRRAGKAKVSKWASNLKFHKSRGPFKVEEIFDALDTLTVSLPGSGVVEDSLKAMAKRIIEIESEKKKLEKEIEKRARFFPEINILMSVPGIGIIYASTIFSEIGDIDNFHSENHLASYAGVIPKKETSGTSVNRNKKAKGGNRRLKNAIVKSAENAILNNPRCRLYYNKKRAEGKKYKSALLSLARQRVKVIYALLKTGSMYEPTADAV
jgi:transposase